MTKRADSTRRDFLKTSAAAVVALPVLQACGGSAGGGGGTTAATAMVADLAVGGAVHSGGVVFIRTEQGIGALSDVCTHRGCNVELGADGDRLECPCHGAAFDLMGNVVNPPAEEPLPWHPVTIVDGQITVDTESTVPQGTFTAI
jgi:cytochrome b6-f complex iron-sulfur subunit